MVKCDFCRYDIEPGTGKMLVLKDARVNHFCSSKCEKNLLKLNRKPRETRWTAEYALVKSKEGKSSGQQGE
jgi:large subunit ribosomal protein L24e